MIPVRSLFEAHLTVSHLERSMKFYGDTLGLELAQVFEERRVAFYWLGGRGHSMLGIWETGTAPQRMSLHVAFAVNEKDLLEAPARLKSAGIVPCDFNGTPTDEPVVLAWMPALSLYFQDPDGHSLEYIAMLPDAPQPDRGVVKWSEWNQK
jgi:lactoylglutathione lyase